MVPGTRPETTGRKGQLPLHASFDAVIANGGTVTHHHAAGRDHRPWYDRQRPPLFAEALRAAPPISILNSRRSREGRPLLGIPRGPGVYRKPHPSLLRDRKGNALSA